MPTRILYEAIGSLETNGRHYESGEETATFFRTYNQFAARGRMERLKTRVLDRRQAEASAEADLLSTPKVWAQDVADAIRTTYRNPKERLEREGKFLFDASLYGFSLEELTCAHIRALQADYVPLETLLTHSSSQREQYQAALDHESIRAYLSTFPTGRGQKERWVAKNSVPQVRRTLDALINSAANYNRTKHPPSPRKNKLLAHL